MQIPNMNRGIWFGLTMAILFVVAIVFGGWLFVVDNAPPAAKQSNVSTTVDDSAVLDKCLDALLRAWTITDVCYNKKNNAYFFNVAPHEHIDGVTDEGWHMLTGFEFIELDNGTWMLRESSQTEKVYPDVSGLTCKSQPADPNWFK